MTEETRSFISNENNYSATSKIKCPNCGSLEVKYIDSLNCYQCKDCKEVF